MQLADTIVAVATARGVGPRAILRLSGPEAIACVSSRTEGVADWTASYRAHRAVFRIIAEGVGVPVSVYVMRGPRSYTCEDVVEAHVPGAPALVEMILDELLQAGARLAEPGEFTRRAFLNGRLDLSRAEAVLAVIRAQSESELIAAGARLQGGVGRRIVVLQDRVSELRALTEASLDFAEEDIELISEEEFLARCGELRHEMESAAERGESEMADRGAYHVVLCGAPNAGKSSLLNRLCGGDMSIVHRMPGTTRDVVTAEVEWDGHRFHLSDTAGLMSQATGADAEAVARARRRISSAHLLILVVDGSAPLPDEAAAMAELTEGARTICALNKVDLPVLVKEADLTKLAGGRLPVRTCAETGAGVEELCAAIVAAVHSGELDARATVSLLNARQRDAVRRAVQEILAAEESVYVGLGYEFAAFNLRQAAAALGEVTGEVTPKEILDRIFSRFCIGK